MLQPPVIADAKPVAAQSAEATTARIAMLRSLRHLVRGLSTVFWSLPLALLVCVEGAATDWLRPLGVFPPVVATALLFYGLGETASFQPQERVWQTALERCRMLALVNLGLSPFIFFWNRFPDEPFFSHMVQAMMVSGILFLGSLNYFLQRLAAMLPDETLREETRFFTVLNLYLLIGIFMVTGLISVLPEFDLPRKLEVIVRILDEGRRQVLLTLLLLPLAMTMTLVWKTKEVVLSSVFGGAE